jgi:uncharacterized protein (TIGR02996 family)
MKKPAQTDPIRTAFLQTIRETPADDTPRLIYADWLEDHGEPDRAEFIRTQVRSNTLDDYSPEREELEARAKVLLAAHRTAWVRELPPWARHTAVFRRGFVAEVRCTSAKLVREGASLRRATPIEEVDLWLGAGAVDALKDCPHLQGLVGLTFSSSLTHAEVVSLAGSPHLGQLRQLKLMGGASQLFRCYHSAEIAWISKPHRFLAERLSVRTARRDRSRCGATIRAVDRTPPEPDRAARYRVDRPGQLASLSEVQ